MLDPERLDPVAGALAFFVHGRGQGLFGQPDQICRRRASAFGDIPVAGFFAAGARPDRRRNFVHGFTASILLFRNGERPKH